MKEPDESKKEREQRKTGTIEAVPGLPEPRVGSRPATGEPPEYENQPENGQQYAHQASGCVRLAQQDVEEGAGEQDESDVRDNPRGARQRHCAPLNQASAPAA